MDTNVMTATDADLAGLGLDPNDLVEAPVIPAAAPAADVLIDAPEAGDSPAEPEGDEVRKPKQTREQIDIGEVALEEDVPLTALVRTAGGSKYKFNELREPVRKEDGTYSYASFRVDMPANIDETKLRKSVASATSQTNRAHKGKGEGFEGKDIYFITRSVVEKGAVVGVRVYRVDGTVGKED